VSASYRVLLAEDEPTYARTVARFLQEKGHQVRSCTTGKAAMAALKESEWDVVLLDLKLPDANGVDILASLRRDHDELQAIIVTGFANVESAISSMRLGAFDYVTKPPNFDELVARVERAAEKTQLVRENQRLRFQAGRVLASEILTHSAAMRQVLRTLQKVAAAQTPVLIEGESGVGKELLAQHLHRISPRSGHAFVDLNCAAVPATLLESELFGHDKGSFTGANTEKPGLVEVADGGTLFLDEVGEMSSELQAKFLRVLDSGTFYRVGATRKRRADFRLVAATNRDLSLEVAEGRFRKDLFFRVNGVRVRVPPLRERPEDVPLLVELFSRGLPAARRFSAAALDALARYDWPGNVRELKYAVERACLLAEGDVIQPGDLPPEIAGPAPPRPSPVSSPEGNEPDRERVRRALEQARWRRQKAAEILGVSPRTLLRWMQRLGLSEE
jgi:DNA-binding NtrC family response regulator